MRSRSRFTSARLITASVGIIFCLLLLWHRFSDTVHSMEHESALISPDQFESIITEFRERRTERGTFNGLKNIFKPNGPSFADGVTLTTHFTVDRIAHFVAICESWRGPVSAAVLIRSAEDHKTLKKMVADSKVVQLYATIHYLLAKSFHGYPVNHLRNFAIQHMSHRTKWVLPLDADFVPGAGVSAEFDERSPVHSRILKDLNEASESVMDSNAVFVVPGFETDLSDVRFNTKKQLRKAVAMQNVRPVLNQTFFLAHENVNYQKWYAATKTYRLRYVFFFEPYYAGLTSSWIDYDEDFSFYGHDKASHAYELAARGWKMYALPESFAVHAKHEDNWSGKPDRPAVYRRIAAQMRAMYAKYKFWPPLPDERWFFRIFTDGDAEQAEFKKELVHFLWERMSAESDVDELEWKEG